MPDPDIMETLRDQSDRHHQAMNALSVTLGTIQNDQRKTYELLAGSFDRPGLVHRMASMESWRQDSPKRWALERGTRIVDAILVAVVLTLGALAIRAFIFQAVQSGSAPYQRDRVALNQEK